MKILKLHDQTLVAAACVRLARYRLPDEGTIDDKLEHFISTVQSASKRTFGDPRRLLAQAMDLATAPAQTRAKVQGRPSQARAFMILGLGIRI